MEKIMRKLTHNVTNILGEKGKKWISDLPNIISVLADHWKLSHIVPVDNMSYNYVAKAMSEIHPQVVLKIGFDEKSILDEKQALCYFDGNASVRLIDYNKKYHALLLEQAIPGITLKSLYPYEDIYVIDIYVNTVQKLHNKILDDKNKFRHIRDWLEAIENQSMSVSRQIPEHLLKKAIHLKNTLLTSMKTEVFLHGDLHHDNILKNGEEWLTIDPKGIVGEPEFEIAAFDFIHSTELADNATLKNLFETRVKLIAEKANLNTQRIKDWVFVRLILSAVWHVEDNGDPSLDIRLAEILN